MADRVSVVLRGHWGSRPVTACSVSVAVTVGMAGRILRLICRCGMVAILSTLLRCGGSRSVGMGLILHGRWLHRLLLLWRLWLLHVWRLRILLTWRRTIGRAWDNTTLWSLRCCASVLLLLLLLLMLLLLRLLLMLVHLSHLLLRLTTRQRSRERLMASVAGGPRSGNRLHDRRRCSKWVIFVGVRWCVRSTRHLRALVSCRVFILVPILASLGIARGPAHPDIAAYAYTTALLSVRPGNFFALKTCNTSDLTSRRWVT
jgi:hypothetical protein